MSAKTNTPSLMTTGSRAPLTGTHIPILVRRRRSRNASGRLRMCIAGYKIVVYRQQQNRNERTTYDGRGHARREARRSYRRLRQGQHKEGDIVGVPRSRQGDRTAGVKDDRRHVRRGRVRGVGQVHRTHQDRGHPEPRRTRADRQPSVRCGQGLHAVPPEQGHRPREIDRRERGRQPIHEPR